MQRLISTAFLLQAICIETSLASTLVQLAAVGGLCPLRSPAQGRGAGDPGADRPDQTLHRGLSQAPTAGQVISG